MTAYGTDDSGRRKAYFEDRMKRSLLKTVGGLVSLFAAALTLVPVVAEEKETVNAPPTLYRMGAASEAVLRCRDLRIVDRGAQADAYREALVKNLSARAMVMGIDDFSKEFAAAYSKGTEQAVCEKYLRRFPSLLTRR